MHELTELIRADMVPALCYLRGGGLKEITAVLNNMASSVTGMICDGGNRGCVMKGIAACAAAFESAELAMSGAAAVRPSGTKSAS